MSETQTASMGFPFFGLLTLIFVIAKITGYLTWSWWLVFTPVLVGGGFVLVILVALIFIATVATLVK